MAIFLSLRILTTLDPILVLAACLLWRSHTEGGRTEPGCASEEQGWPVRPPQNEQPPIQVRHAVQQAQVEELRRELPPHLLQHLAGNRHVASLDLLACVWHLHIT
jgi:hypothetical protein